MVLKQSTRWYHETPTRLCVEEVDGLVTATANEILAITRCQQAYYKKVKQIDIGNQNNCIQYTCLAGKRHSA